MAKKPELSELAAQNPQADIDAVKRTIKATEALRQIGVKPMGYTLRGSGGRTSAPMTPKGKAVQRLRGLKMPKPA